MYYIGSPPLVGVVSMWIRDIVVLL